MKPASDALAIFGTEEPALEACAATSGDLELLVENGAATAIRFRGVEVLRRIDYPIRDADWRTHALLETAAELKHVRGGFAYVREFLTADATIAGRFRLAAAEGALEADVELTAQRDVIVNRAGFILLHPIAGVAGTQLVVRHSDGAAEALRFPDRISPAQPVRDIVGLSHRVGPIEVEIAMEGEIFEMEDQRNWSDASYKTYCRPLALPRPFRLAAGETLRQRVTIALRAAGPGPGKVAATAAAPSVAPRILLAHDAGSEGGPHLSRLGVEGLLLRLGSDAPAALLPDGLNAPVTLEVVLDPGEETGAALAALAERCTDPGVVVRRAVALPRGYLASHQPEGPWPDGPTPGDLIAPLRAAFPEAEIGGGVLTNFTEFNRCRPDPAAIDFATFGSSAIVHAADDRSVLETLETFPEIFRSAAALAPGRPLHLGLISIGMRSNPYGAAVAPNPERSRVAMAMDDPRQRGLFAAAWAVGIAAAAARGGVASLALAMAGGPLGLGADGALWPLYHVVRALAALGGREVAVTGGAGPGLAALTGAGADGIAGIAANAGFVPARFAPPEGARLLRLGPAGSGGPDWVLGAGESGAGTVELGPFEVIVVKSTAGT